MTGTRTATKKPRIITLTVRRLRQMAKRWQGSDGDLLYAWADELNAFDARESRLEPRLRKAAKAKKRKAVSAASRR